MLAILGAMLPHPVALSSPPHPILSPSWRKMAPGWPNIAQHSAKMNQNNLQDLSLPHHNHHHHPHPAALPPPPPHPSPPVPHLEGSTTTSAKQRDTPSGGEDHIRYLKQSLTTDTPGQKKVHTLRGPTFTCAKIFHVRFSSLLLQC